MERLKSLNPFNQLMALLLIGIVCYFIISMLFNVSIAFVIPEIAALSTQEQIANYPKAFMVLNMLPLPLGLFLVPSILYIQLSKRDQFILFTRKNVVWSITLFTSVILLLPFLTQINEWVIERIINLDYILETKETQTNYLNLLFGTETPFANYVLATIIVALTAGVTEELFFRRFIQRNIRTNTKNKWLAILLTSLLFALLHLNWVQFLPIFLSGVALGLVYELTGSIYTGIVLHVLNNALNVFWIHTDSFPNILQTNTWFSSALLITLVAFLIFLKRKSLQASLEN